MKKRVLALVLVLTMMTMGVAYAAWSQAVTVSGDVATGELKMVMYPHEEVEFFFEDNWQIVDFDDGTYAAQWLRTSDYLTYNDEYTEFGSTRDLKDNYNYSVDIVAEDFYPGSIGLTGFILRNEGTIPTKLRFSEETLLPGFVIDKYRINLITEGGNWNNINTSYEGYDTLEAANSILSGVRLLPGDEIMLFVRLEADLDSDENGMFEENTSVDGNTIDEYIFEIPLIIEQYNTVD